LDHTLPANALFFDAIRRHALNLGRRGCPRTALEFNKLLLSLAPAIDPACVLVNLDYYCLRAREYAYLVDFFQAFDPNDFELFPAGANRAVPPRLLPNFAFSVALAKWQQEGYPSSIASLSDVAVAGDRVKGLSASGLLLRALLLFPDAVQPLLKKSNEQEVKKAAWTAVFGHSHFASSEERMRTMPFWAKMINIFAERHGAVWRPDKVCRHLLCHQAFVLQLLICAMLHHCPARSMALDTRPGYRARYQPAAGPSGPGCSSRSAARPVLRWSHTREVSIARRFGL